MGKAMRTIFYSFFAFIFGFLVPSGGASLWLHLSNGAVCFLVTCVLYRSIASACASSRAIRADKQVIHGFDCSDLVEYAMQNFTIKNNNVRIGDAERDFVIDELNQHYIAGRLKKHELEERHAKALGAVTGSDLVKLTVDLPVLDSTSRSVARKEIR